MEVKIKKIIESVFGRFYHPIVKFIRIQKNKVSLKLHPDKFYSAEKRKEKFLFVDITLLRHSDSGTGIQRVQNEFNRCVSSFLKNYTLEYIYVKDYEGFYSVRTEKPVVFTKNDVYLTLELRMDTVLRNEMIFRYLYKMGTRIFFFVHDLIPITHLEYSYLKSSNSFKKYLNKILAFTGIITNSNAVKNDVINYAKDQKIKIRDNFVLDYDHLGCNFNQDQEVLEIKNEFPEFLMVSTVEVRKKYDQVLEAFEKLWKEGFEGVLRIVGRPGWNNDRTINQINNSTYLNTKLFWYNTGISDEELKNMYKNCDAVIFASITEGYGLALAEAASYKKPLIIRDIPIFREIAGNKALYFSGESGEVIEKAVKTFITKKNNGTVILPEVKYTTWEDFTKRLLNLISVE